jgi:hypothetical protein
MQATRWLWKNMPQTGKPVFKQRIPSSLVEKTLI